MIKIILLLLALVLGFILSLFTVGTKKILLFILIGFAYTIGMILLEVIFFFLIAILLGLPINTKKKYNDYSKFYRRVFYHYVSFALKLFGVKVHYENTENIPDGNFVLVCNHRSNFDSFVLDCLLQNKKLAFYAKESLFKIPFFGKMIYRLNYLSLERNRSKKDFEELNRGKYLMNNLGYTLGIFPEGKRNFTDEILLPFETGYEYLARETQKPIAIFTLKGTDNIRHNLLFKRHDVYLKFIDTIKYDEYSILQKGELNKVITDKMYNNLVEGTK